MQTLQILVYQMSEVGKLIQYIVCKYNKWQNKGKNSFQMLSGSAWKHLGWKAPNFPLGND